MGIKVVVLGASSNHGGNVISASGSFRTSAGIPAMDGDMHECPIKGHGVTPVRSRRFSPACNGRPILMTGDMAECGAEVIGTASMTLG